MNIAVDFDDVLYPYHAFLKRRLQLRFGIDLTSTRVTTFYYELLPAFRARGIAREDVWKEVRDAWSESESHDTASLMDAHAVPALARLGRRHKIIIATARHRSARPHVEAFLRRHKIKPDQILLDRHEKSGFDVLVDDFPVHAIENALAGGHSILYTIDENSTFDESRHPRIHRVHSWAEVEATIHRIEQERTGRA